MMAGVFSLMTIIFVYAYNGKFVAYLTAPKYERLVNTLEALADERPLYIMASKSSVAAQNYLVSTKCCFFP